MMNARSNGQGRRSSAEQNLSSAVQLVGIAARSPAPHATKPLGSCSSPPDHSHQLVRPVFYTC
jgi:hypothetical protein